MRTATSMPSSTSNNIAIRQGQPHRQGAVVGQHPVDDWQHMETAESDRRRNLQVASGFRVFAADSSLGSVDVLHYLLAALEVDFATLGQADRSRRSGQQRHAELVFELGDRPGDDRGRKPQLSGSFGKTSQPCNRGVDAHGVETVHPPLLKQQ